MSLLARIKAEALKREVDDLARVEKMLPLGVLLAILRRYPAMWMVPAGLILTGGILGHAL